MIRKIVSGGQTGADRAALDWAIRRQIEHGGYCPKGRKAEDGTIPPLYKLTELETASYLKQTERNVLESDGTLLVTWGKTATGGSARTAAFCKQHNRPLLHVHRRSDLPGKWLRAFVQQHRISTLNVAGPRASSAPQIGDFVDEVLDSAFRRKREGDTPHAEVKQLEPKSQRGANDLKQLLSIAFEIERYEELFQVQFEKVLKTSRPPSAADTLASFKEVIRAASSERWEILKKVGKYRRELASE